MIRGEERGGQGSPFNSKEEGEESLFLGHYELMWPVDAGLCAVMSRKHIGPFSLQKERFETLSLVILPFI